MSDGSAGDIWNPADILKLAAWDKQCYLLVVSQVGQCVVVEKVGNGKRSANTSPLEVPTVAMAQPGKVLCPKRQLSALGQLGTEGCIQCSSNHGHVEVRHRSHKPGSRVEKS